MWPAWAHRSSAAAANLENQVLSQSYSDVFLIGGVASLAGMVLAFFLPGRQRA